MNKNITFFSAKAFACFFVVCIHISFPGKIGYIITNFARFAVPFFFMITGYYTVHKNKKEMSGKINKRLKKLAKLTLISFIFYFILNIFVNIKNGTLEEYILGIKSCENIFKFLLLNWTTPFVGVGHLWYLFALLYVMLLLKVVNKYDLYKKSYILSILIIVGIYFWELIDSYFKLGISQIYYRNAWFMGFSFFMLGHFIRVNEKKFLLSNKKLLILSAFMMIGILVLLHIEPRIINGDNCLYLSSLLTNILIFIIAINKKNINVFSKIGEFYSGDIYIIHYSIIVLIDNFIILNINKMFLPILVFIISYLLSVIYRKTKEKFVKQLQLKNNIVKQV